MKMENTFFVLEKGRIDDSERMYEIHTSAIRQLCSTHYDEKEITLWAGKQKQETYVPFLENGDIIVAKKDGMVVGFIHLIEHGKQSHTNKSCSNHENHGITIKGLFIDPNFARKGLGKLLFKQVEAIALEKGVTIMKVSASLNSLPFYQKMGFKEVERNLHQITCECSVQCVSMVKHLTKTN